MRELSFGIFVSKVLSVRKAGYGRKSGLFASLGLSASLSASLGRKSSIQKIELEKSLASYSFP